MITHDRWLRIKEIFHSAQDRPPSERSDFLDEVCGDDVSMREELEALLTADAGNDNFLTSPAYEFAAGMLANEASEFAAGQTVGRYEILCPLGAGGMGQIYLARDAQLNRNIALKLISREFATDPRRVLRFEQEARAASALSHPNVCVIHEIGITDNGRHFIAMEYIQGVTLRDHLARGPLKLADALQIAIQVGTALASAHAVGIVHRDIKPENIMLRPDGYAKVVDFGLAKLTEALPEQRLQGEGQTMLLTEPRTLMGTVKYMSPEQLREMTVDERTDIWSLGVVLYEMVTGSTPFDARSPNDSVAFILGTQPAQLSFPEELPIRYREIVKKTLKMDCDERYQTVTKLTADLRSLKRELDRNPEGLTTVASMQSSPFLYGPISSEQHPQKGLSSSILTRLKSQALSTADSLFTEIRTHKAAALFAGATSVLALLFLLPTVLAWVNGVLSPGRSLPQTTMKPVTNRGKSIWSAISPDGKLVAHAEEQRGKQHLAITDTTTFQSSIAVPPGDEQYVGISFSRDSKYLYFTRRKKNEPGTLYQLAWPGNNPVKLKTGVDGPISFSPTGDRFAYVRHDQAANEFLLMMSNVDGTNEQVVARRKNGERLSVYGPAWSPDGSMIVSAASYWRNGFHTDLIAFNLNNGSEQLIGKSWFSILQVAWQDMSSLVISARERITAPHQLWRIGFPDGAAEIITPDPNEYAGVSLSGGNIVTVRTSLNWGLWVSSLDEPQKTTEIISGVGLNYGISWTSKRQILFSSMIQDRLNISRIDPDGQNQVQLTSAGENYSPASSPDGRFIVFASNLNGPFNIWRMNAEGSNPIRMTSGDGDFYPSISPDGQWVAYDNLLDSGISIWKVSMNGGEPVKLAEKYRLPVFSPNNQFIAARYNLESGPDDVAIFPAQGGPPVRHFEVPFQEWQRLQWLSDNELSFVKNENGYSNIWSINLETGVTKQLTNFNSDQIYAYAWSPDYKQVACQRGSKTSDVTMISER